MRKFIYATIIVVVTLVLASCGRQTYRTYSGGKENVSYIVVLRESRGIPTDEVTIVVDGYVHQYGKVYTTKMKRKAVPLIIEPGEHTVEVVVNGEKMFDEKIFLAVQQTKQYTLR